MKGVFVIGTDTGVGKTLVAAGVARMLLRRGLRVGVFKPASSGGVPSVDGRLLRRGARLGSEWASTVVPVNYRRPLAPYVAGWTEGAWDARKVEKARRRLASCFEFLVVEGVGGLQVPLTRRTRISSLVKKWGYPVLVVARAGLGTINHTLLTVESLRRLRVKILGVLMNGVRGKTPAETTNVRALRRLLDVPVFGPLKWDPMYRRNLDRLARHLARLGLDRVVG